MAEASGPNRAPFIKPDHEAVDRILALPKAGHPRHWRRAFGALTTLYSLLLAGACVYVPWGEFYGTRYAPRVNSLGYGFLWAPPRYSASVDTTRLLLEIVAITALYVGVAVWVWLAGRRAFTTS